MDGSIAQLGEGIKILLLRTYPSVVGGDSIKTSSNKNSFEQQKDTKLRPNFKACRLIGASVLGGYRRTL